VTSTTAKLTGEVVVPGDPGYEAVRIGWNRLYSRYPETIVFCADAQDVINAVEWARTEGIALRARSGRHCLEGWSSLDGGLVIDVSRMKSVEIDETARTVRVGTGLVQKEAVAALGERLPTPVLSPALSRLTAQHDEITALRCHLRAGQTNVRSLRR
jgi:FAD/FMN-containing dehydrogenase